MDKGWIAEKALEPVLGPARASGVAGDLLEAGRAHSAAWFWSNLLRTWAGALVRDFAGHPLFLLEQAVRGALLLSASLFGLARVRTLASAFIRASFSHSHFLVRHPKEWLWPAAGLAALLATFGAGRWLARRAPGREAAVCAAMGLVFPFVYYGFAAVRAAAAALGARPGPLLLPDFGRFWYLPADAGFIAAFLLGAALLRRPADPRAA